MKSCLAGDILVLTHQGQTLVHNEPRLALEFASTDDKETRYRYIKLVSSDRTSEFYFMTASGYYWSVDPFRANVTLTPKLSVATPLRLVR
jgi:hypothetical protein